MKYRKHLIITSILYAIFTIAAFDGVKTESIKMNLNDLINKRVATGYDETGPGDCCTNGWRQWNSGNMSDGLDCWCEEREEVTSECSC